MEVSIKMKKALLNVDYTYDFVARGWKAHMRKPGQTIEQAIVGLTKQFFGKRRRLGRVCC